jgi:uncharacterized protein DUF6438
MPRRLDAMTRRALAIVVASLACCSNRSETAPPPTPAPASPAPAAEPVNPAPENPAPENLAPVAEQRPPAPARSPWLKFSRAACFGTCPVYLVRVFNDGSVEYDGQAYVKQKGRRTKVLDAASMKQLRDLVADPRLKALGAKCCDCYEVTDQDSATIEVRESAAVTRTIVHYHGCTRAPEFLGPLEDSFDRLIGTEAWIGTPKQREKIQH